MRGIIGAIVAAVLVLALVALSGNNSGTLSPAVTYAPIQQQIPREILIQNHFERPQYIPKQTIQPEYQPPEAIQPVQQMEQKEITQKTVVEKLLDNSPKTYLYNDGDITIYAHDAWRSTMEYRPTRFNAPAGAYWNTETQEFFLYLGDIPTKWWKMHTREEKTPTVGLETSAVVGSDEYAPAFLKFQMRDENYNNFVFDNTKKLHKYFGLPDYALPALSAPYYIESPFDWLRRYAKEPATVVEDLDELLLPVPGKTTLAKLGLRFESKEIEIPIYKPNKAAYLRQDPRAEYIVFRFDSRNYPVAIDEVNEEGKLIRRHSFTIERNYEKNGKMREILQPTVAKIPEKHVILTLEEWDLWRDAKEEQRPRA